MKTEPFGPSLAAIFITAFAVAVPAQAGGPSDGTGPAPAPEAKPKIVQPQPKPDKPASTTLKGLHLKLGNVELKVRGPVIIDAGPKNGADTSEQGH